MKPVVVRFENVSLTIRPWQGGWRFSWQDGTRLRWVSRSTVGKAKDAALAVAKRIAKENPTLESLTAEQAQAVRRLVEVGLTPKLVEDYLEWRGASWTATLGPTVESFLATKEANMGLSERNIRSLGGDLRSLVATIGAGRRLVSITTRQIEKWIGRHEGLSPRRKRNLRGSAVTFFRWCRRRKMLPDETTAAEAVERPIVTRPIPDTYTPKEMGQMLAACPSEYLPWLLLQGFCGLRLAEMFPPPKSRKSPLAWEDIDFGRGLITVRPETSKTRDRRVIAMPSGIARICATNARGRVCPVQPPHKRLKGVQSLTVRLGAISGRGWLPNGLRNSFISYRAALVGLAQTAMEAGNSEAEARRSYHDAKSRAEAVEWFALVGGYQGAEIQQINDLWKYSESSSIPRSA